MKTVLAIILYCLAIVTLLVFGGVIIWNLIIWPPCTQVSSTLCTVEPWTAAGLAGTVLAIAATVLAVLGAVAVAAWWTSLNDIVTNRVTKLYNKQEKKIQEQVKQLLEVQKKEADDQLRESRSEIQILKQSTRDIEANLIDSLLELNGPSGLEKWAQQAYQKHMIPATLPMKMALGYFRDFERTAGDAIKQQNHVSKTIAEFVSEYEEYKLQLSDLEAVAKLLKIQQSCSALSRKKATADVLPHNLASWGRFMYWFSITTELQDSTKQTEQIDGETIESLKEKIALYELNVAELKMSIRAAEDRMTTLLKDIRTKLAPISEEDLESAEDIRRGEEYVAAEEAFQAGQEEFQAYLEKANH